MTEPFFVDLISTVNAVIPHALHAVWPRLLDQATWMQEFKIETVFGEHGREGEIKRVSAPPGQPEFPPFLFKTLRIVPFHKYVYKAFSAVAGGVFTFTGIEALSISALGNDTAVTFEAYLEVQSATMTSAELEDFVTQAKHDSAAMWQRNLARLARAVAGQRTSSTV